MDKFHEVFICEKGALDSRQVTGFDPSRQLACQVLGQAIAGSNTQATNRRIAEGSTHFGPTAVHRNGQLIGTQVWTSKVVRFLVRGLP